MHYRSLFVLTLTLWSVLSLSPSKAFSGEAPFKRATVQSLRNQVRLLLKDQPPRPAKRLDIMIPGDALATARTASAELTFNDSTIARLGEQALFRFLPNVRDFRLDNGTLVLLIPPGLGGTRVRTPNAAAGIRGSALFVRYNPDTNTTLVGALTNSQIEVSNQDDSQKQVLKAGQMAVIVQGRIERVYDFDLNTFYETSELVKGLDLTRREAAANSNPAIAAVQAETAEAIRTQVPVIGQGILTNPAFVRLGQPGDPTAVVPLGGVDRNIPNTISPVTGVAGDLQRVVSGKQTPSEPTTPVVGRTPSTPERPSAPVGGRPAPLPEAPGTASIPTPPGLPSLPSQPNPTAPSARPAPLPPDLPVPPTSEGTAPAVPQPPAVAQPAPAPLPPAIVQPVPQPPAVAQPAPAPLPSAIVQPAPAPLPPAIVQPVPQPPAIAQPAPAPLPPAIAQPVPQPPAIAQPAPAPLPPAIVQPAPQPPAIVVQPAPAPLPPAIVQPAPAPLPLAPAIVQPAPAPLPSAPAIIQPAPALVAPSPPPISPVPATPLSIDTPPIAPAANPVIHPPAATTPLVILEIKPSSARVAVPVLK